jgi:hypothetical protein
MSTPTAKTVHDGQEPNLYQALVTETDANGLKLLRGITGEMTDRFTVTSTDPSTSTEPPEPKDYDSRINELTIAIARARTSQNLL